ncbi:MAG: hypothetical protein ABIN20_06645 [candidate division WOR-3 bacterium]
MILFIFLNYTAKIFMKYPFKYERIVGGDTTSCWYGEDSVVTQARIIVRIYKKFDRKFLEKEGILNDSGFCAINFDYWDNGEEVKTLNIEKMEIFLPDANIVKSKVDANFICKINPQ